MSKNIKLRLHLSNDHEVDWVVPAPYDITFQDVLDIIEQVRTSRHARLADHDASLVTGE